jgi:RNA polymerase sigma factor (sigma-70 family)
VGFGAAVARLTKQAFVTAVEKTHGLQLRRFLAARLRNAAADTPDLMQEVYLRLLRVADHETIRNPQAYLFTVASHVLHQHTLRQSMTSPTLLESPLECAFVGLSDPAAEAELDEVFVELERTLQRLSPKVYAALILSRCDGMTLKEIADRLGVSRQMVKKYLAKALIHIRQRLSEMSEEVR